MEHENNTPIAVVGRNLYELQAITQWARAVLAHHQLEQWSFQFDHATKRAGCCHYTAHFISLSAEFAKRAPGVPLLRGGVPRQNVTERHPIPGGGKQRRTSSAAVLRFVMSAPWVVVLRLGTTCESWTVGVEEPQQETEKSRTQMELLRDHPLVAKE